MRNALLFVCLICWGRPGLCQRATTTPAARTCKLDSIQNYVALGSTGCTIGPYLFYDIQYSASANGGAIVPTVWVMPANNNNQLRGGAHLTGLSLTGNWLAIGGSSLTYTLSVSVQSLSGPGIPGGVAGYGGSPFPTTTTPPNQWGLSSYTLSDTNGDLVTGSNLVTNFTCNSCISTGGGAQLFVTSFPNSMTLSYTYEFSTGVGGLVEEEEQFTGVER